MTSGAQTWDDWFVEVDWGIHGFPVGSRVFFLPPGCSFWLLGILGIEVGDAHDDSWRCSFAKQLYLAAKPSHIGVDVNGLACPLHWHMGHSCQSRGHGLSARRYPVLSLEWAVVPFEGCELPRHRYLMERWPLWYLYYWILHMVNHFYQVMLIR
jgi:hypothetical protein